MPYLDPSWGMRNISYTIDMNILATIEIYFTHVMCIYIYILIFASNDVF